jgi:hypothetical protein
MEGVNSTRSVMWTFVKGNKAYNNYLSGNSSMFLHLLPGEGNVSIKYTHDFPEYKVAISILSYVLPAVIIIGSVGNILSFVVLMRQRMRNTSVYVYLAVLACADTSVLYLSAFKTWLRMLTGFELLHISNFSCKIIIFLFLLSLHLSAWLIVITTFDRFVAIWMPFKAANVCVVHCARKITISLITILVIYNLHVFWTIKLEERYMDGRITQQCAPSPEDYFMTVVFEYIKLASYSAIPFAIVLALNMSIIHKITQARPKLRRSFRGNISKDAQSPNDDIRWNKVTYMLLTISFTWLLLTAPFTL